MRRKFLVPAIVLTSLFLAGPAAAEHGDKPTAAPAGAESAASPEATLTGIVQVQAGYNVSCGRTTTGQVRCWGDNDDGELGNGNTNPHDFAVPVRNSAGAGNLSNVLQVAVGDDHACALLANHQVKCWGDNEYGELGNGDAPTDRSRPVTVRNAGNTGPLANVIQVSAESDGACALLSNHQVRCWGENDYGQLGNSQTGDAFNSDLPVTVRNVADTGPLRTVRSIEMAYDNNCAVLQNGQARCWGYNSDGELGNNDTTDTDVPVAVLNPSGTAPLSNVNQITAGGYQACALLTNHQVRCWGENDDGEVGDGTLNERDLPVVTKNQSGSGPLTNVLAVSGGYDHFCALIQGGEVRCWGDNEYGQVGDGNGSVPQPDRKLPRPVNALTGSGHLTGVVQLHANQAHTCAVLTNHEVRCWGYNSSSQLGNGGTTSKSRPVRVLV